MDGGLSFIRSRARTFLDIIYVVRGMCSVCDCVKDNGNDKPSDRKNDNLKTCPSDDIVVDEIFPVDTVCCFFFRIYLPMFYLLFLFIYFFGHCTVYVGSLYSA